MKIVVFGLSLSSSWGNGHATSYRGLLKAFAARGHHVTFLERDVPWYAAHRDLPDPDYCDLKLYGGLDELAAHEREIAQADAVILGSYVQEGPTLARWLKERCRGVLAFYDIDTPVTVGKLKAGDEEYIARADVPLFDLYLSFSGGPIMQEIERAFGARRVRLLGCSADTDAYTPLPVRKEYALGYLGTYAESRQAALERLLIEPARRLPDHRFIVAGPQYPDDLAWPSNVERIDHVAPGDHAAFYSSLDLALNVTRSDMVTAGFSPSVRVFEAAACGVPVVTDAWPGLDAFFDEGRDILVARETEDVVSLIGAPPADLAAIAAAGRERILHDHSATRRAEELEAHLAEAMRAEPVRRASS